MTVLPWCLISIWLSIFWEMWVLISSLQLVPPNYPPQLFHLRKWHQYTFSYSNSNPGIILDSSLSFPHGHMEYVSKFCWLYLQDYPDFAADTSTSAILIQASIIFVLIALSAPSLSFGVKLQPKCQKVMSNISRICHSPAWNTPVASSHT